MTNEERNAQMANMVQHQFALALGQAMMEKIEAQAAASVFSQELQALAAQAPQPAEAQPAEVPYNKVNLVPRTE